MFSPEYYKEIKAAFDRQMELADERIRQLGQEAHGEDAGINALTARLLAEKKKEILDTLERCTQEEAQALAPAEEEPAEEEKKVYGEPDPVQFGDRVVGIIESRDGTIMDVVREIKPYEFK